MSLYGIASAPGEVSGGGGGGGGGVTSLNSETGDLDIVSGDGSVDITTPTATTIDLSVPAGGGLTLAAFGSTPNADGLTLTAGVLNMEPADATHPGGVSTTTQSFGGGKTIVGNANQVQFTLVPNATQTANIMEVDTTAGDPLFTIGPDNVIVGNPGTEADGINILGITFESTFKVSDIDGTNFAQTILHRHSTVLEPLIIGARSNSDTSAHVQVTPGMNLFTAYGAGITGSGGAENYKLFASITLASSLNGTISGSSAPGQIIFSTTPDGATTPTAHLTLDEDKSSTFAGEILATGANFSGLTASKLVATDGSKNLVSQDTGNLTEATSSVLTITGGTGSVVGSGTSIQVKQAGSSQSGYLSDTDWNTFNNKGSGSVTSFSFTDGANVDGTVSNSTTTPTLSLAPVTASPAASSFASWDSNKNLFANNHISDAYEISASGGTYTMDASSPKITYVNNNSGTQTILLPDASTIPQTTEYIFYVSGTSNAVTVQNASAGAVVTLYRGRYTLTNTSNSTTGAWTVADVVREVRAGGTGSSTLTQYAVLLGNATSALSTASPTATSGIPLVSNGSSANPSFAALNLAASGAVTGILPPLNRSTAVNAQTADYTLLTTDSIVTFDASGGNKTATLPTAASVSGLTFVIKKIDSSTNYVALNTTSSQTIDGIASGTLKLATQYESITVCSDGSNWIILDHKCDTSTTAFTPTGAWSSNVTYTGFWRRVGDCMEYTGGIAATNTTTSATLTVNLPSGYTIDTAKLAKSTGVQILGSARMTTGGDAVGYDLQAVYSSTTAIAFRYQATNSGTNPVNVNTSGAVSNSAPGTFQNNDNITWEVKVPITNWFA